MIVVPNQLVRLSRCLRAAPFEVPFCVLSSFSGIDESRLDRLEEENPVSSPRFRTSSYLHARPTESMTTTHDSEWKATGNSCSASSSAVCHLSLSLAFVSASVANLNASVPTSAWATNDVKPPEPRPRPALSATTRVSKKGNSYGVVSKNSRPMTLFLGGGRAAKC